MSVVHVLSQAPFCMCLREQAPYGSSPPIDTNRQGDPIDVRVVSVSLLMLVREGGVQFTGYLIRLANGHVFFESQPSPQLDQYALAQTLGALELVRERPVSSADLHRAVAGGAPAFIRLRSDWSDAFRKHGFLVVHCTP